MTEAVGMVGERASASTGDGAGIGSNSDRIVARDFAQAADASGSTTGRSTRGVGFPGRGANDALLFGMNDDDGEKRGREAMRRFVKERFEEGKTMETDAGDPGTGSSSTFTNRSRP